MNAVIQRKSRLRKRRGAEPEQRTPAARQYEQQEGEREHRGHLGRVVGRTAPRAEQLAEAGARTSLRSLREPLVEVDEVAGAVVRELDPDSRSCTRSAGMGSATSTHSADRSRSRAPASTPSIRTRTRVFDSGAVRTTRWAGAPAARPCATQRSLLPTAMRRPASNMSRRGSVGSGSTRMSVHPFDG